MFQENLTLKECKRLLNYVTNLDIRSRSFVIAMILWFFLGFFGVHRLYIHKTFSGICMGMLALLGFATKFILIGYVFWGIVWIWWFLDLFMLLMHVGKSKSQSHYYPYQS